MEGNTSSKFLVAEDLEVVPEAETLPLSTEATRRSVGLFEGRIYVTLPTARGRPGPRGAALQHGRLCRALARCT